MIRKENLYSNILETSNGNKNHFIIRNERFFANICSHYQAGNINITTFQIEILRTK